MAHGLGSASERAVCCGATAHLGRMLSDVRWVVSRTNLRVAACVYPSRRPHEKTQLERLLSDGKLDGAPCTRSQKAKLA